MMTLNKFLAQLYRLQRNMLAMRDNPDVTKSYADREFCRGYVEAIRDIRQLMLNNAELIIRESLEETVEIEVNDD